MLVLLALDAFILGSFGVALVAGGHHGLLWWLALIPLAALGSYLGYHTWRVRGLLRRL
jgi:hypothetical protein